MAKDREQNIHQPSQQQQKEYISLRDNDPATVYIAGTNRKYKIRWLRNGQLVKLSRLLLKKESDDSADTEDPGLLPEIEEDGKLACKAAAIYILDGYWKIKLRYWFLWRWFYYIRQYSCSQLQPILDMGKKKVPLIQFYSATMSLTEAKGTLMNMTTREAEHILRELRSAQDSQTASNSNGSTSRGISSSDS